MADSPRMSMTPSIGGIMPRWVRMEPALLLMFSSGQRIATLNGATEAFVTGVNYWGNSPIDLYQPSGVHFQHQDWTGTERVRTTNAGVVEGTFQSYAFGDR